MPKFEFISDARPSLFAYPPATKPPKKETVTKVATAVLSTTAKAKAREKKKAAEGEGMDLVCIDFLSVMSCLTDTLRTKRRRVMATLR